MDILVIYAIATGSVLGALVVIRLLRSLSRWKSPIFVFVSRHVVYPYVIARHRLVGPWSRVSVFAHLAYFALNSIVVFFRGLSLENTSRRSANLSLINMIFLLAAGHLSYAADLLGITLRIYRQMHRASGWMTMALITAHIVALLLNKRSTIPGSGIQQLFTIIVSDQTVKRQFIPN